MLRCYVIDDISNVVGADLCLISQRRIYILTCCVVNQY